MKNYAMAVMSYTILVLTVLLLTGCASPPIGSVAGGECKLVSAPSYAVKGKTSYDQEWVDDTTEALVRGCKQPRPKARPASIDNPPRVKIIMSSPTTGVALRPKVKHWWQR